MFVDTVLWPGSISGSDRSPTDEIGLLGGTNVVCLTGVYLAGVRWIRKGADGFYFNLAGSELATALAPMGVPHLSPEDLARGRRQFKWIANTALAPLGVPHLNPVDPARGCISLPDRSLPRRSPMGPERGKGVCLARVILPWHDANW